MAKKAAATAALVSFTMPAAFLELDTSTEAVDDKRPSTPFMGFFTDRSKVEITDQLKASGILPTPGLAFVRDGDTCVDVTSRPVVLLSEFSFWGEYDWDEGGRLTAASLKLDKTLDESFLIVTAHLATKDSEDTVIAVSRVLKSQAGFCRDLVRGVRDAGTKEFIAKVKGKDAQLAGALAGLPARFRVTGKIKANVRKSQSSKYSYLATSCKVQPISLGSFARLGRALQDPEFQALLQERSDTFEFRKGEVLKIAGN